MEVSPWSEFELLGEFSVNNFYQAYNSCMQSSCKVMCSGMEM